MKIQKTNAMRMLDQAHLPYQVHTYEHDKEAIDGVHVAQMLKLNEEQVFKTLVTIANTKQYFVFVIPVNHELDLKQCAKVAKVKRIEMIHVKDLLKITGYIRGGCSPIGMKKTFTTFVHESALNFETIYFSGGKIGLQIQMNPQDLQTLINCKFENIIS